MHEPVFFWSFIFVFFSLLLPLVTNNNLLMPSMKYRASSLSLAVLINFKFDNSAEQCLFSVT